MSARALKKLIFGFATLAVAGAVCTTMVWEFRREGRIKAFDYIRSASDKSTRDISDDGLADYYDPDAVITDYNKALELEAGDKGIDAFAYLRRGDVKIFKGDMVGAMTDFDKALELFPNGQPIYDERGFVKLSQGDADGAIADYNKALVSIPDNIDTYESRANAKLIKGDFDGAIADYSKVIELDTSVFPSFIATIQLNLTLRRLRRSAAPAELEKVVKSPLANFYITIAQFLAGDLPEADLISEAVKGDAKLSKPGHQCEAFYYIGMTHLLQNDPAGAKEFFTKCVNTQVMNAQEYVLAKAELARLADSNPPATLRPSPPPAAALSPI